MKSKTMMDVVRELVSQGHSVSYSVRKDGGILIRYIDGVHYSGAKGNAMARSMVGATLSEAREKQLTFITRVRKKKASLPDEIEKAYQRAKRKWRKAFHSKEGKPHPAGYFDKRRIRWTMEHYGEEEAMRRIAEAEKYATGYAYTKNVQHLADYVLDAGQKYGSEELIQLAKDILNNAYAIKEEWIYPAYAKLYELNNGVDPKQVASDTRRILRL